MSKHLGAQGTFNKRNPSWPGAPLLEQEPFSSPAVAACRARFTAEPARGSDSAPSAAHGSHAAPVSSPPLAAAFGCVSL